MTDNAFVYVTYIATTPEKLWEALTSGEFTEQYFFGSEVRSDWREGSTVTYSRNGQVTDQGTILKCEPYRLLSFTWNYVGDKSDRKQPSRVTFELKPMDATVKLTLKHDDLQPTDIVERDDTFEGLNNGWPAILSNLKSLLETGRPAANFLIPEHMVKSRKTMGKRMNIVSKMKIVKPVAEVFEALVDPAKMSNYWFSSGSGRWEQGKTVTLRYEEYDAQVDIKVLEIEENRKIVFQWGPAGEQSVVTITLHELDPATTKIEVNEEVSRENEDELIHYVIGNKEGWVYMLTCLKGYLEFGVAKLRAGIMW